MLQESLSRVNKVPNDDIKYAQQHLANERTYLAWIRTAISIIGLGFLTTSLHFTIKMSQNQIINELAIFLGAFACLTGIIIGVLATWQYSKKRKQIQFGIFIPANVFIIFVSLFIALLILLIFIYLSFLLIKG